MQIINLNDDFVLSTITSFSYEKKIHSRRTSLQVSYLHT